MPNQKQFRFDLNESQKQTIREQTGETVEKYEDSVKPRGFRMF